NNVHGLPTRCSNPRESGSSRLAGPRGSVENWGVLLPDAAMPCFVYASLRKHDSYLWLAERDAFDVLPEPLLLLLGELRFVMEVQLDEQRKLPNEDTLQVLDHLR